MSERRASALAVLRRGLRDDPEFMQGARWTAAFAIAAAAGTLLIPILIQQVIDRGLQRGFDARFIYPACAVTGVLVIVVYLAARTSYARMVRATEAALRSLRVRTFAHIHSLTVAAQNEERRGVFVARVTADIDAIADFMDWGALTWVMSSALIVGTFTAMLVYSWKLALVIVVFVVPLALVLRRLQRGMLAAYEGVRGAVSHMLAEISEFVMGAAVVRAYGLERQMDHRLKDAIEGQYRARMRANLFTATIFPTSDLFGGLALAAVFVLGLSFPEAFDLTPGRLIAFLFLTTLFLQPLGELSEAFGETQTAVAGWRKVQGVLDLKVDMTEPVPGVTLPPGPLEVRVEGVHFSYVDGEQVLHDIDVHVPAGGHVAIVGQTGCGKTTFAKLLCRLADPDRGRILLGGVDLRAVAPGSRRRAIHMVPQDGFLFDATVADNVRFGRPGATDAEVERVFDELGLRGWVESLPAGPATVVGERGENLSVGERQLVAVARAHLASPGLLILDEATSAVDPGTELILAEALARLSRGRTVITIAHRLSTAATADGVLVFERGRVVERGRHHELVEAGGIYAAMYESWLGNTRPAREGAVVKEGER